MSGKRQRIPRPIGVLGDVPAAHPTLGFPAYVDALASAVRGGRPAQFTVGLYGPWGSGKSSLLHGLQAALEEDPKITTVYFDAWRYERSPHIVVPLLHKISSALASAGHTSLAAQLKRALAALMYSFDFKAAGVGVSASKALEQWGDDDPLPLLDDAFDKPFTEMAEAGRLLADRRVVVLIDDLDRCSPQSLVAVLEAINLVMDVPGFVFVLALDYDVLVRAIDEKYPHVSGHSFVEKMIQLPFRVPPLALDSPHDLLQLLPQEELHHDLAPFFLDVANSALGANPRQVKRLFNSYLVLARILEVRSTEGHERLLAVLGLQLAWPDWYRSFLTAVLAGRVKRWFVDAVASSSDPALARYAQLILEERCEDIGAVRETLRLTAITAFEKPQPILPEPSTASPSELAEQLARFLTEMGFAADPDRTGGEKCFEQSAAVRVEIDGSVAYVRQWDCERAGWAQPMPFYLDHTSYKLIVAHIRAALSGP